MYTDPTQGYRIKSEINMAITVDIVKFQRHFAKSFENAIHFYLVEDDP